MMVSPVADGKYDEMTTGDVYNRRRSDDIGSSSDDNDDDRSSMMTCEANRRDNRMPACEASNEQ